MCAVRCRLACFRMIVNRLQYSSWLWACSVACVLWFYMILMIIYHASEQALQRISISNYNSLVSLSTAILELINEQLHHIVYIHFVTQVIWYKFDASEIPKAITTVWMVLKPCKSWGFSRRLSSPGLASSRWSCKPPGMPWPRQLQLQRHGSKWWKVYGSLVISPKEMIFWWVGHDLPYNYT